jgi:hypothetical protein
MTDADEPCNRCLVLRDNRERHVATWREGTEVRKELSPSLPQLIVPWFQTMMSESGGDATFTYMASTHTLRAVATWNGDPVCAMHLWDLADQELRPPQRRV